MKKILSLIIGMASFVGFAQTNTIPSSLPIGSQEEYRTYALGLVKSGSRQVTSVSMNWDYPGSRTYTNTAGVYAEDVLARLFAQDFLYELSNPKDLVDGYVWLYGATNTLLFFGYAEYNISTNGPTRPQYAIWQQPIPLLDNVLWAEVIALNPDGSSSPQIISVFVDQGHIQWNPWLCGAINGLLVVKFKDGRTVSYRLSDPTVHGLDGITERSGYKIDGHYIYDTTGNQKTNLTASILELYTRPTVFLKTPMGIQMTFDVAGVVQTNNLITLERPSALIMTPDGKDGGYNIPLNTNGPTAVNIPIGTFRMKFIWDKFALPPYLYTGSGGKGGGGGGGVGVTTPVGQSSN